jgi:hypothetical protein
MDEDVSGDITGATQDIEMVGSSIWASNTSWASRQVKPVGPPYQAWMQSDGNFVLYNGRNPGSSGQPYWATNTSRSQGQFTAIIQSDGNFIIYAGTPSGNPSLPGPQPSGEATHSTHRHTIDSHQPSAPGHAGAAASKTWRVQEFWMFLVAPMLQVR